MENYEAEISTVKGQKIAAKLILKNAHNMRPVFVDSFRRVVFEADVSDAKRLLKALKGLGSLQDSRQIPESLVCRPVLGKVESFLREVGVPEYLPPEETAGAEQVCSRLVYERKPVRIDGGYLVLTSDLLIRFVSDDGDIGRVCLPRHMDFEAAIYRLCTGRLPLNVRHEKRVPPSVLQQIAQMLRDDAPQLIPVILP